MATIITAAQPTWHQLKALQRARKLRNNPAHILKGDYIFMGKTLCGVKDPAVYVETNKRHNPANEVCQRCLAIADKGKVLSL